MFFRFLHFLGVALWVGGGFAVMAMAIRARREPPETRRALAKLLPAASSVIGLGAAITVIAGMLLVLRLAVAGAGQALATPGRFVMMGSGIIASLLVFLVSWPASFTLARLASEPGELSPEFEKIRKRQAVAASVAGGLGLVALIGATLLR